MVSFPVLTSSAKTTKAAAWFGRAAAVTLAVGLLTDQSHATPVTYVNATDAIPYTQLSPSGDAPTNPIGAEFYTSQIVINQSGNSIDLQFSTTFPGPGGVVVGTQTINAADIFLATGAHAAATPIAPTAYNFAIVLGDQTANGGLATPGLYQVASAITSQTVWGNRPGYIYGGQYALASNLADAQTGPVALTAGTLVSGWTVVETWSGGLLDVTLTATDAATLASLVGTDDIFWGTGDCDNGPIFEQVSLSPNDVPEPASLTLFAAGLVSLFFLQRRPGMGLRAAS